MQPGGAAHHGSHNMETFSQATAGTDSVNFNQRNVTGSPADTENDERDVHTKTVEDSTHRFNNKPSFEAGNEKLDSSDGRGNMGTAQLKQSEILGSKPRDNSIEDIIRGEECRTVNSSSNDEGDDVAVGSDDDNDNDDDDDIDEGECNLVVNMDLADDLQRAETSPSTLTPLSIPKMIKSFPSPTVPSSSLTWPHQIADSIAKTSFEGKMQSADNVAKMLATLPMVTEVVPKKVTSNSRSLPIHCVIEQMSAVVGDCKDHHIILDSYAILPGCTLFLELVKASLSRLGYSSSEATGAKGCIQLKNWKTLAFDAVTDNVEATVEEILGELSGVATLRIYLNSQTSIRSDSDDVRDRLLQLLLTKSIDFLIQTGCPIEKSVLETISTGKISQGISEQVCSSFNDWYTRQKVNNSALLELPKPSDHATSNRSPAADSSPPSQSTVSSDFLNVVSGIPPAADLPVASSSPNAKSQMSEMRDNSRPSPDNQTSLCRLSPLNLDTRKEHTVTIKSESSSKDPPNSQDVLNRNPHVYGHKEPDIPQRNKKAADKTTEKNILKSELCKLARSPSEGNIPSTIQNHQSNLYLGLMPGKTRIRTSFDPEHEIPRLQKWFSANQHPTREQMMRFMTELNGLESRKGRRHLDLTNIIYWFKNARAAQRRATRVIDDSFENEENMDVNSIGSGNSNTDSVPPFLPNKNAVYMIPFHPYSHFVSGGGGGVTTDRGGSTPGVNVDEPYDLSLTKRPSSEISKTLTGKGKAENNVLSLSSSPSPTKSSSTSSECDSHGSSLKRKKPYCPPKFPALLDVATKMRQEIPVRSEDNYFSSNNIGNNVNHNGCQGSPYRSRSGSSDLEQPAKTEDIDNHLSNPNTPFQNGDCAGDHLTADFKVKQKDTEFFSNQNSRKGCHQRSLGGFRESCFELKQVKKEEEEDEKMTLSDDDTTNDSYNSEEELKLRMKQNAAAAVADYASAMQNNVTRLTAANMAALSLAQMGQPLHIPQLTSSLAMAYYPMDPRFYSQPAVQHSLPASPPSSLASTHASHLSHLSLRQSQDCAARVDSRSPLPPPSVMQQSLNQLNHHHHHQHHQRQSPQQQHHHRHSSEPRKRRTRVFIDPLTEIPKLEKWFTEDTHPSAFMIDKYCDELNKCEYRHKFPKLEPKNVQLWFKNHRAKVKRMKVSCDDQGDHEHDGTCGHDDDIDD